MTDRNTVEAAIREKLDRSVKLQIVDSCCTLVCDTPDGVVWVELDISPELTWQQHFEMAQHYADSIKVAIELQVSRKHQ